MAHHADPTSTVRAVAIATKWVRHRAMVKKAIVIGVRKVVATTTARVPIAKKAADVGGRRSAPR